MRRATTRDTTLSPDWQTGKSSTECNRYMLEQQLGCDVTFEVGQSKEIIRAHSYILKSRSQTLCHFLSRPAFGLPYPLPSATPEDLICVLRYCYTDMSHLTIDTVIGVLHLSKEFNIGALRDNCIAFITSHLSDDNVCHFLEQAHHHQEEDLGNTCVELALNHGETVIRSYGFLHLCHECVWRIITPDSLRAREVTVYQRLLEWARTRLEQNNTSITDLNLRDSLGQLLYSIRFPLLGMNYFASQIAHRDLLTDAEKVSIFRYLTGADRSAGLFGTVRRVGSPVTLTPDTRTCVRFTHNVGPLGDEILENTDANRRLGLALSCTKLVALRGLLLYRGRRAEYAVTVKLFSHLGDVLHEETVQLTTSEGQETTSIEFGRPVVLEPGLIYVLSVQTASYSRYYGAGGSIQIKNGAEIFTFYECPLPDHSSSLSQGDLPGILYSADTG
ncbi:BTB/POZ domain-containing protein 1-like [Haliotis rubra]|uniref:BTB/POZ domain-containing protein 1-like n=1 Tax=Haliotis rubra TaxID=36100 RepID=UPI001EE5FE13|nr:BTB/POZ domain-containing protein 1-like [Haliotis rubra]